MAYVKPRTDQTGHSSVDGVSPTFATAVQASNAGFGVVDPNTGTFEVLDALPLGRQAAQLAVEAGSTVDFATEDFLTDAEVGASARKIKEGAGSDLT